MFNSNHVGRPSNEELKKKRNLKILLYCAPILIIVFVVVLYTSGSLSGLMGNSVSSLYCDEGYILRGSNCTKTITTTAYLLGDINKDNLLDVSDITAMQRIANDFTSIDDEQKALADVNEDGKVDITDMTLLQKYFAGDNSLNTYSQGGNIGRKRVCAVGYNLKGTNCEKIETIPAKTKDKEYTCQDQTYKLEGNVCTKTVNAKPILIGDVNKDGRIDVLDETLLQKYFAEKIKFDDTQMLLADLDNSGIVDVTDLTYMQLYLAGKMNNKRNSGTSGTGSSGYEAFKIGKTKICPSGYNFNSNKTICSKIDTVSAIEK